MVKNRIFIIIEVYFLAIRRLASQNTDIKFSIVKVIASSNYLDADNINLNDELKKIQMENLRQNYSKLVEETLTMEDHRLKKEKETEMEQENSSAKSQDIFQNNKVANHQKKKKKYTTTRKFFIKHRLR